MPRLFVGEISGAPSSELEYNLRPVEVEPGSEPHPFGGVPKIDIQISCQARVPGIECMIAQGQLAGTDIFRPDGDKLPIFRIEQLRMTANGGVPVSRREGIGCGRRVIDATYIQAVTLNVGLCFGVLAIIVGLAAQRNKLITAPYFVALVGIAIEGQKAEFVDHLYVYFGSRQIAVVREDDVLGAQFPAVSRDLILEAGNVFVVAV